MALKYLTIFTKFFFVLYLCVGFAHAQPSALFTEGGLGNSSASYTKSASSQSFLDLGIQSITLSQSGSGRYFQLQGNDLPVVITLTPVTGSAITFNGIVSWRATTGSTVEALGVLPDPGTSTSFLSSITSPSSNYQILNDGANSGSDETQIFLEINTRLHTSIFQ